MSSDSMAAKATAAKDPVCGMEVDPKAADVIKTQYGDKTYYFCSEKCKKDFQADPKKYVHEKMASQDMARAWGHQ
jgi:YHS domain-containing protein